MILAMLRLTRLYYGVPLAGGFVVIVLYLTGGNVDHILYKVITAWLAILSIISAGYILNDLCDVEIDKVNCPNRPLAGAKISSKISVITAIVLFAAGMLLSGFCGWRFAGVMAVVAGLLIFYDVFSKRLGIVKNILAALLTTSLYPLAFALTEAVDTPRLNVLFIHPVWLFLSALSYQMLKDIRDIKGDGIVNGKILKNYTASKWFGLGAKIFIVGGALITMLPFVLGYCKQVYLVASAGAIILAGISVFHKPTWAIRCIYAEVFLITAGSLADLLVFGS